MRGVFIGVGGTGDWILTFLKDKIQASLGEIPSTLQFRLVDTESPEYRSQHAATLGEKKKRGIETKEYVQLEEKPAGRLRGIAKEIDQNPIRVPAYANWFRAPLFLKNESEAKFNLTRGAAQHRQLGRMGVFLNVNPLMTTIRSAIQNCRSGGTTEVPVWIIGSVAGGTGAGTLLDLGILVRKAAEKVPGTRLHLVGVVVLPDVYRSERVDYGRAFAALREIQRFHRPVSTSDLGREPRSQKSYRFAVDYGEADLKALVDGHLFDNLVYYNRPCDREEDRLNFYSQVADAFSLLLDESAGNQLFREWINVKEGFAASFNSQTIFLPIRMYERQIYLRSAARLIDSLLPKDQNGSLASGAREDRMHDARGMLQDRISPLFKELLNLREEHQFAEYVKEFTPEHIVNDFLGFSNPVLFYGEDISEDLRNSAALLHRELTAGIKIYGEVRSDKETFENSKIRFATSIKNAFLDYTSQREGVSFAHALSTIRKRVEERWCAQVAKAVQDYLQTSQAENEGLARTIVVMRFIETLLKETLANLNKITAQDPVRMNKERDQESQALENMNKAPKPLPLIGGKGKLPDLQTEYASYAIARNQVWQRIELTSFLKQLIELLDREFKKWLAQLELWQTALDASLGECRMELGEIEERLRRQKRITSSSLGVENDEKMGGYQEYLEEICQTDKQTKTNYVNDLTKLLSWELAWPGENRALLTGWGKDERVEARKFGDHLRQYLAPRIAERIRAHEGIANYFLWLKEKNKWNPEQVANQLVQVNEAFVDARPHSVTRKYLLLYGDLWTKEKHGEESDPFGEVHSWLVNHAKIGEVRNNLYDGGTNLFKDRNVLALLMVDREIPYANIEVIGTMEQDYRVHQENPDVSWVVSCHHIFGCEQEAWKIERWHYMRNQDKGYPFLPGEYVRLLDDAEFFRWFVKALVAGVIREVDDGLDGKAWVCGLGMPGGGHLYLTNPEDRSRGPQDLLRALVTFAQDRQNRKHNMGGTIDVQKIKTWINEALAKEGRTLIEKAKDYKDAFDRSYIDHYETHERVFKDPRQAFLGLVLEYYINEIITNP